MAAETKVVEMVAAATGAVMVMAEKAALTGAVTLVVMVAPKAGPSVAVKAGEYPARVAT